MSIQRCAWVGLERGENTRMIEYHDREWGVPVHDDRAWFEFLTLEGAQAGLSWSTVLNKRARYREVFDGFDPAVVAGYDGAKIAALLADPGIIRNRLKVESTVSNAVAFLEIQQRYGSFDAYIWQFVGGRPKINRWRDPAEVPASVAESDSMSHALKRQGFRFVGSTICYALMQATGMVNDHTTECFRHAELGGV